MNHLISLFLCAAVVVGLVPRTLLACLACLSCQLYDATGIGSINWEKATGERGGNITWP